jgi:serine/threonine protein kinase
MNSEATSLDVTTPETGRPALAREQERPHTPYFMLQEPSPEAPLPFGRYQLIRRIGAGGMGEVFLAREGGPHPRACVVKKVLPNLVANRAFVGRFLDEAKVVVRLNHNNIARVYAMGDVDGEYFLSMEYVQGKTVSRFTKRLRDRKAEMPLGIVLLLGEKVCEGLQYAHLATDETGSPLHLVHRDLSPANVCISYRGDVKIIDFGAAQSTLKEEQTAPRVVIGNLTYMAPEQAKKLIVDARADVYSCGVMLWELLAWHALPQKGDPIERWRRAANPVWDAPSKNNRSVPRDVDELVLKALKKEPGDRWTNAAEFGAALRKARLRHAPDVKDKDLGELLARVFHKEKVNEDYVLQEVVYGKTVTPMVGDRSRQRSMVPPTALAFEHTAVMAPADILKQNDEVTDPGRPDPTLNDDGTPTPAKDPRLLGPKPLPVHLLEQRKSFGLTFGDVHEPLIEASLIQEIEATGDEEPYVSGEAFTTEYRGPAGLQKLALFGGIFFVAVGLGFLGVWLALK